MQSSVVVSEPSPNASERGEHTSTTEADAYAVAREGRQFRRPDGVQTSSARRLNREVQVPPEVFQLVDEQLNDLIFSWRRLTDPKLKKLAIQIIQSMAD